MAEDSKRSFPLVTPAIVVFWAVMMALLVQREVWPRLQATWGESRSATYADLIKDLPENYRSRMRMTWRGRDVGVTTSALRKVGDRFTLTTRTELSTGVLANLFLVPRDEAEQRVTGDDSGIIVDSETTIGPNFHLIGFRALAQTQPKAHKLAEIKGRMAGDKLRVAVTDFSGRTFDAELPFDPAFMLTQSLDAQFSAGNLEVGRTWRMQMVNPLTGKIDEAFAKVARAEPFRWNNAVQQVFVIEVKYGKFETTSWVATTGEVLRQTTPFGLTLEREPIKTNTEGDAQEP